MTQVHRFESTGDAYDACQCDENVKIGDVIVIEQEEVVGVAFAWPFAITAAHGVLHYIAPGTTIEELEGGQFVAAAAAAKEVAKTLGFPLAGEQPEEDDEPDDSCPNNPEGGAHEYECTGTAYGGEDERWHGEGRCLCIWCGHDGDG